jgi:hypothetical protein
MKNTNDHNDAIQIVMGIAMGVALLLFLLWGMG